MARTYRLFISHSWTYGDAYDRLAELLNRRAGFRYEDYSVPSDDPIHYAPDTAALVMALAQQIDPCDVVLIMSGVYATYSEWIQREISIADQLSKPILAIKPWANKRVSTVVEENADGFANWNTESIIGEIRRLAGPVGEDPLSWLLQTT